MPTVIAQGKSFTCPQGANLRKVLIENSIDLYNGNAKIINCMGIGSCGRGHGCRTKFGNVRCPSCAVEIEEEVSAPNWKDKTRRSLPPHSPNRNLRLACQTKVLGDIRVTKYDGFWGQGNSCVWTPEAVSEGI
jgi:ferredoxin